MKKRYRDENGKLTISIDQIKRETAEEAKVYYQPGNIYFNSEDGEEYVYLLPRENGVKLAHFQSWGGKNLFIPVDSLGTFLPSVASEGMGLIKAE